MNSKQRMAVAKDSLLFTVGLGGIVYQLLTGRVDVALLAVFTAMTGVPGLTNLVSLLRGDSDTSGTRSPSPSRPSPPDSQP